MEKTKTCVYRLKKIDNTSENSTDERESQKIYTYMTRMSYNAGSPRIKYGETLHLTNWILHSGATCHMIPEISDFIPVSLAETYQYIKVPDGHIIIEKQTEKFQIEMRDYNGKPFIAMLYSVLLVPDLCDQIFSIIKLMNSGHTCLSCKRFCAIFFSNNKQNVVTLLNSAKRSHKQH